MKMNEIGILPKVIDEKTFGCYDDNYINKLSKHCENAFEFFGYKGENNKILELYPGSYINLTKDLYGRYDFKTHGMLCSPTTPTERFNCFKASTDFIFFIKNYDDIIEERTPYVYYNKTRNLIGILNFDTMKIDVYKTENDGSVR